MRIPLRDTFGRSTAFTIARASTQSSLPNMAANGADSLCLSGGGRAPRCRRDRRVNEQAWFGAKQRQFAREISFHHHFRGRPPFLPHPDSFLRCLRVVVVPPFLPMQRGQIIRVSGWRGQYAGMAPHIPIPQHPLSSLRLAFLSSSPPPFSPLR
jgi:hypothetical protein